MRLLGDWNWWVPRPLARLLPGVRRDRLPRAGLQRRRPAGEPAGRRRAAVGARRRRAAVLVGLRDRAGGRGARPARVLQRVRADRDARSSPERLLDACKAVERAFGRTQAGEAATSARAARRSTSTCCCSGDVEYASERLTLPHREVMSRRFVLVPLLELDPDLERARPRARGRRARAARTARTCGGPARRWTSGPDAAGRRRRQHADAPRRLRRRPSWCTTGASPPCASRPPTSSARRCATCSRCAGSAFARHRRLDRLRHRAVAAAASGRRWPQRYLGHEMLLVGPGPEDRDADPLRQPARDRARTGSSTPSPATSGSGGACVIVDFGTAVTHDVVSAPAASTWAA